MRYRTAQFSRAGRKVHNQDRLLYWQSDNHILLAIADGMGGEEDGASASRIAVESVDRLSQGRWPIDLPAAFKEAQKQLVNFAHQHHIARMGSTLTACTIEDGALSVAHVGDTRLYLLENSTLHPLTKDQTELQAQLDAGILSAEEAASYPSNVLLSALTNFSPYTLYQLERKVVKGDRLLLMSDGAYELITEVEMTACLMQKSALEAGVDEIRRLIESRNIHDDYSLLACELY